MEFQLCDADVRDKVNSDVPALQPEQETEYILIELIAGGVAKHLAGGVAKH